MCCFPPGPSVAALPSAVRIPSHQLHWLPSPSPNLRSCRLSPVACLLLLQTRPPGSSNPSPAPRLSPVASAPPRPKGGLIKTNESKGKRATQSLPPRRISRKDTPSLISLIPCPKPPTPPLCPPPAQRNFEAPVQDSPVLQQSSHRGGLPIAGCLHLPAQKAREVAGERQVATV